TFSEPGSTDTHWVRIDWGDGSVPTELMLPAGEFAFESQHVYQDDDPTGSPVDVAPIEVTVSDPDTDSATAGTTVEVRNEAPSEPELRLSSPSVSEGSALTLGGTFTDAGVLDTHRVFVDWGDGSVPTELSLQAGQLSFEAQHVYRDDPAGSG